MGTYEVEKLVSRLARTRTGIFKHSLRLSSVWPQGEHNYIVWRVQRDLRVHKYNLIERTHLRIFYKLEAPGTRRESSSRSAQRMTCALSSIAVRCIRGRSFHNSS
jgi:hypothetical protein